MRLLVTVTLITPSEKVAYSKLSNGPYVFSSRAIAGNAGKSPVDPSRRTRAALTAGGNFILISSSENEIVS